MKIPHWIVRNVKYVENYKLNITFADGSTKVVDLENNLDGEVFEPLKDTEFFKTVHADGTSIAWENGADFAPEFLYEIGIDIPKQNETKIS